MKMKELKESLDQLFARLSPPYDIVPEWHGPGVTANEMKEVERRFLALPNEVKLVCSEFSGLGHDCPLYMGEEFESLHRLVIEKNPDFELDDDLGISKIVDLRFWGTDPEMSEIKEMDISCLLETQERNRIACDFDLKKLEDDNFVMIGATSYSDCIYIDLTDPESPDFGKIYNTIASAYPYFMMFKMADSYLDLMKKLKKSLEIKLSE